MDKLGLGRKSDEREGVERWGEESKLVELSLLFGYTNLLKERSEKRVEKNKVKLIIFDYL